MQEPAAPVLRPLGIGDIVDRTISLYRGAPRLFLLLAALPYLVLTILAIGLNLAFPRIGSFTAANIFDPADPSKFNITPAQITDLTIYGVVTGIASFLVVSVQAAAVVDAMSKRYLGQPATLRGSLAIGLRASVRLMLAAVAAFFGVMLAFAVMFGVIGAAAVIARGPVAVVLVLGGFILFGVAIFYVLASWMTLPAVVIIEGLRPLASLRRSWRLARGARWRILGLLMLMGILEVILGVLFAVVLLGVVATQGPVRIVLQETANLAVNAVWAPLQWGVFTLLYYDLRVRKEAFDLQLAAEAMPRAT